MWRYKANNGEQREKITKVVVQRSDNLPPLPLQEENERKNIRYHNNQSDLIDDTGEFLAVRFDLELARIARRHVKRHRADDTVHTELSHLGVGILSDLLEVIMRTYKTHRISDKPT